MTAASATGSLSASALAKEMVKDHKNDIRAFEKDAKSAQDPAKSFMGWTATAVMGVAVLAMAITSIV
jgi:hypothetical protein